MHKSVKFWDNIADRYEKKPIADKAAYKKKLNVTQDYLQSNMDVIELGCGTGSTAIKHAPHVRHIRAIDISSKMIAFAKKKAQQENIHNISFEQAPIHGLSIQEQSIDAVLAMNVLHLLQHQELVIEQVHRMLKPGGLFVVSLACLGDTKPYFKLLAPVGTLLGVLPPLNIFTLKSIKENFIDVGFNIDYQWQQPRGNKTVFLVVKKDQ